MMEIRNDFIVEEQPEVVASTLDGDMLFADFTIRHTVTACNLEGKYMLIAHDTTKTKSSLRTLPLVPMFKQKLLDAQERQKEYRRLCGRSYDNRYLDYKTPSDRSDGAWRRRWDSNPRGLSPYLISSQGRYDHFDTPPRQTPLYPIGG